MSTKINNTKSTTVTASATSVVDSTSAKAPKVEVKAEKLSPEDRAIARLREEHATIVTDPTRAAYLSGVREACAPLTAHVDPIVADLAFARAASARKAALRDARDAALLAALAKR